MLNVISWNTVDEIWIWISFGLESCRRQLCSMPSAGRNIKYIKKFKICGAFVSAKTRNYKSFNRTTGLLYLRFKNSFFFSRQRLTVSAVILGDLMSVGQQGPVLENSKGHLAFRGIKPKHKIPLSLYKHFFFIEQARSLFLCLKWELV